MAKTKDTTDFDWVLTDAQRDVLVNTSAGWDSLEPSVKRVGELMVDAWTQGRMSEEQRFDLQHNLELMKMFYNTKGLEPLFLPPEKDAKHLKKYEQGLRKSWGRRW